MITTSEIHWLAGLFEGEGCFSWERHEQAPGCYIGMTDLDIIQRVARLLKVRSRIDRRSGRPGMRRDLYFLKVIGARGVGLMMTLYPLLGERRKARIRELLTGWQKIPMANGYRKRIWTAASKDLQAYVT